MEPAGRGASCSMERPVAWRPTTLPAYWAHIHRRPAGSARGREQGNVRDLPGKPARAHVGVPTSSTPSCCVACGSPCVARHVPCAGACRHHPHPCAPEACHHCTRHGAVPARASPGACVGGPALVGVWRVRSCGHAYTLRQACARTRAARTYCTCLRTPTCPRRWARLACKLLLLEDAPSSRQYLQALPSMDKGLPALWEEGELQQLQCLYVIVKVGGGGWWGRADAGWAWHRDVGVPGRWAGRQARRCALRSTGCMHHAPHTCARAKPG